MHDCALINLSICIASNTVLAAQISLHRHMHSQCSCMNGHTHTHKPHTQKHTHTHTHTHTRTHTRTLCWYCTEAAGEYSQGIGLRSVLAFPCAAADPGLRKPAHLMHPGTSVYIRYANWTVDLCRGARPGPPPSIGEARAHA